MDRRTTRRAHPDQTPRGAVISTIEPSSARSVPGTAGILPATGRRPAIVQAGKMPVNPGKAAHASSIRGAASLGYEPRRHRSTGAGRRHSARCPNGTGPPGTEEDTAGLEWDRSKSRDSSIPFIQRERSSGIAGVPPAGVQAGGTPAIPGKPRKSVKRDDQSRANRRSNRRHDGKIMRLAESVAESVVLATNRTVRFCSTRVVRLFS